MILLSECFTCQHRNASRFTVHLMNESVFFLQNKTDKQLFARFLFLQVEHVPIFTVCMMILRECFQFEALSRGKKRQRLRYETVFFFGLSCNVPVIVDDQGQTPILNAKVTALVYPPTSTDGVDSAAASPSEPIEVVLSDRGTGDPDITANDGIYSAYFTRPSHVAGHYAVVLRVTDNGRRASIPLPSYDGKQIET